MAIFKCKMCGGSLETTDGERVATCEYCGTQQTLPKTNDDVISNLFNRANNLRLKCEFDKAATIYEKIVEQDDSEAEAHWGIVLCKYGIEYVEDPKTHKRIPTCHRTLFDAVTADADYLAAIDYSDAAQQHIYESEARAIDKIQKDILAIVKNEKPFDVFICYKETDENGKRTIDSSIANDIYYQLTQEGFKVFFAAITLEDKLGQEYEPYIFAALNSAKVMLVLGTKPEYFSAVWVKNEWSRFLQRMRTDRSKLLIPCYRDMDAYDLPEEFAHLQAQDMSKIGFINDVVRGIKKVIKTAEPKAAVKETVVVEGNASIAPLLKRAFMFLEDGEWERADEFCEQVLNIDPECAEAYLGKLMAELEVYGREDLGILYDPFDKNINYQKAIRFADENLKKELQGYIDAILTAAYYYAKDAMESANNEDDYEEAAELFKELNDFKDSEELAKECLAKAEGAKPDAALISYLAEKREQIKPFNDLIAVPGLSTVGLKVDGSLIVAGMDYAKNKLSTWSNISAIKTCGSRLYGIKLNGTVVNDGYLERDRVCETWHNVVDVVGDEVVVALRKDGKVFINMDMNKISRYDGNWIKSRGDDWYDIVAVAAGDKHAVGLSSNGFLKACGYNDNGQCCRPIGGNTIAIAAGYAHTVFLKKDGTVTAYGSNDWGQCDVESWKDIVEIVAHNKLTFGLKKSGTVVATAPLPESNLNSAGYGWAETISVITQEWSNIISISVSDHVVGLKADGTVVAVSPRNEGKAACNVDDWTDIIAIKAGAYSTVGLKTDGTVVAVGRNEEGQCNVDNFKLFDSYLTFVEERKAALRLKELVYSRKTQDLCQHCGGAFKGLFTKKCVSCGKLKDY